MGRLPNFSFPYFTALFLLLGTRSVVGALNITFPHAQTNDTRIGWQAQPKGRGTFGLLVNCLITLFLCVWTTIHVNIEPEGLSNRTISKLFQDPSQSLDQSTDQSPTVWGTIEGWLAKRWIRKSGWSIVSLVFPEVPLMIAMYENKTADMLQKEMLKLEEREMLKLGKKLKDESGADTKEWEECKADKWGDLALSFFVIMGGFRVRLEKEVTGPEQGGFTEKPTVTQAGDVRAGEVSLQPHRGSSQGLHNSPKGIATSVATEQGPPYDPENKKFERKYGCTLTPQGVLFLAQQPGGFRNELSAAQVRDRSKAGTLAKVIVVAQASWMAIQVLCRTAAGLTVAVLEVHVILHVLCSLCMYFIWWGKPVDIDKQETVPVTKAQLELLVQGPAALHNPTNPFKAPKNKKIAVLNTAPSPMHEESPCGGQPTNEQDKDRYLVTRSGLGKLLYIQLCDKRKLPSAYFLVMHIAFERLIESSHKTWKEGLALSLIALVYGGAHLSTWNNKFVTVYELWLWRSSSILTAVSMGALVLSLFIGVLLKNILSGNKELRCLLTKLWGIGCGLALIPVLFARVFLLVECFIALRELPADAYYSVAWTETWPHLN